MKLSSLVLASSIALVPATVALADDAKKEALKKAKEEAKKKALEEAKAKFEKKAEAKIEAVEKKIETKKVDKKAEEAAAKEAAAKAEAELHSKHSGLIERLGEIAAFNKDAELTALVEQLKGKEDKRHALAAPAAN